MITYQSADVMKPAEKDKFLKEKMIPEILDLIEKSGISFEDASMIPVYLKNAIEDCTSYARERIRFVSEDWTHKR